jgi:hypothetical protein
MALGIFDTKWKNVKMPATGAWRITNILLNWKLAKMAYKFSLGNLGTGCLKKNPMS